MFREPGCTFVDHNTVHARLVLLPKHNSFVIHEQPGCAEKAIWPFHSR